MHHKRFHLIIGALVIGVDLFLGSVIQPLGAWINNDLFFMFHKSAIEKHDVFQYGLKRNYQTLEKFGPIASPIFTNSLGFRDNAVRNIKPASGSDQWLFIGDSFTYGSGIQYYGDTFAGRIDRQLPCIDILNAGVPSYSPANYFSKVNFYLGSGLLKVGRVAVFIDISDPYDERERLVNGSGVVERRTEPSSRHALMPTAKANKRRPPENVKATLSKANSLRHAKQWLRQHSLTARLVYEMKDMIFSPKPRSWEFDLDYLRNLGMWTVENDLLRNYAAQGLMRSAQNLSRLAAFLKGRGIPLTLAVYPWPHQIISDDQNSIQVRYWREWSRRHGATFIDLFPAFFTGQSAQETVGKYFIPGDVHWNEAGHEIIADSFLKLGGAGELLNCPEGSSSHRRK